jgi:hypothetical protein
MDLKEYELQVFITHFVPPQISKTQRLSDFIRPRLTLEYLRSWARLVKHGTRGNQPWKSDIMTKPRAKRAEFRDEYLAQVISGLEQIDSKKLMIHIFSNEDFHYPTLSPKTAVKIHKFERYKAMHSQNNSPWTMDYESNPWNLLWEHKESLRELSKEKVDFKRLVIILENDVSLRTENLIYWLRERERLRDSGLVPSFLRLEYSKSLKDWICIDLHNLKSDTSGAKKFLINDSNYLQIPSLYSGITILDRELLGEYVSSSAIDKIGSSRLIWWDLGARASMGIQFVNIPEGYADRHVIGLDSKTQFASLGSLLHHLPNLYSSVPKLEGRFLSFSELPNWIQKVVS